MRKIDEDLIKALRCIGSQDAEGNCYMEHYNTLHSCGDEPPISCSSSPIDEKNLCPYYQNKYSVCFEDGECGEWLNDVADILEKVGKLQNEQRDSF